MNDEVIEPLPPSDGKDVVLGIDEKPEKVTAAKKAPAKQQGRTK